MFIRHFHESHQHQYNHYSATLKSQFRSCETIFLLFQNKVTITNNEIFYETIFQCCNYRVSPQSEYTPEQKRFSTPTYSDGGRCPIGSRTAKSSELVDVRVIRRSLDVILLFFLLTGCTVRFINAANFSCLYAVVSKHG